MTGLLWITMRVLQGHDFAPLREAFWSAERGTKLRFVRSECAWQIEALNEGKLLGLSQLENARMLSRSVESGTSFVVPQSKTLRVTVRSVGQ